MKIEIEKRNDISSKIEGYIRKRAKKLEKYLKEDALMKIVVSHQKGNFLIETTINDYGNILHSKASLPDIELSIDESLKKIETQAKKLKEKIVNHKKVHLPSFFQEKEEEQVPVVKTRRIEPAILFIEEAINELIFQENPFFVFKNKETAIYNIIYRAKNGTYQILEF
ncbi:MAG: ribosome-associated translation inhibitor RaiA [bacterium]